MLFSNTTNDDQKTPRNKRGIIRGIISTDEQHPLSIHGAQTSLLLLVSCQEFSWTSRAQASSTAVRNTTGQQEHNLYL